jgi:integrase
VVDVDGLAVGGWLDRTYLTRWPALRDAVIACGLPIKVNLLRVTRFRTVDGRPWRSRPIAATELVDLLRHVIIASFLVTAYLSGVRTGEALNLRRGCIVRDSKLGVSAPPGVSWWRRGPAGADGPRVVPVRG